MSTYRRVLNEISANSKRFISGKRRKYPINSEDAEKLPVFQYTVSKKEYRRVFAWGNLQTGALGIPALKRNESIDKLYYLQSPKRIGFGEKFEVRTACCGFGFSVFAVNSNTNDKIYGCGINTDSQIGYHEVRQHKPLGLIFYPQPIPLPFLSPEKSRVLKITAGRAHLVVLTDEGIFTLGNNAYGQCGRSIIPDEDYSRSNYINRIETIDGKKIVDIECGQDHSMAVTEDGCVYSCGWGADGQTGLGHFRNTPEFTRVKGDIESEKIVRLSCRSDFVLALNNKGEPDNFAGSCSTVAHSETHKNATPIGKIKSIASGGSFCVVVLVLKLNNRRRPILIPETLFGRNDFQPNNIVRKVTCGLNYAAAVTSLGDLFIWGRNKGACLGLGTEKDQYFPLKVAMGGHVQDVFCGIDHTIAICKPFI
ncbi:hypothetical protein NQ318_003494 [Aromia moschata]|uniref:RCC1-like G exchanging factor-like protein n=1 Tax=Aromia moschata TaxID=1265417 RepID=A0AAV8YUR7_9CUCU|nr:hypothetical protein NQ318_003494 [Aromia moschata]